MAADPQVTELSGDPDLAEAMRRFNRCAEWEGTARERFLDDLKFAHGDDCNGYQWPNAIKRHRDVDSRPCLTLNNIRQHNLQIINASKQSKLAGAVKPLGNGATKESADVLASVIRRIEYQSNAQNIYSMAQEFQVDAGIGWWRIVTDWAGGEGEHAFDQEIFLRPVNDPLSIYMDPDIQQKDGSDARFAFVFDTVPKDEFDEAYPEYADLGGLQPMGVSVSDPSWVAEDHVRVCEYFRKVPKKDKVLSFVNPNNGRRQTIRASRMHPDHRDLVLDDPQTRWRTVHDDVVEWKLIVGDKIVDQTEWVGRYIPLVRIIGTETIIEGILDRKGHTRTMRDAQRMYNYNSPLALDTRLPTPIGWTTMGDVRKGDWLLDERGRPVEVAGTSPIFTGRKCFRVHFDDGSSIVADQVHLWRVEERGKRTSASWSWSSKTIKTEELTPKKHFIYLGESFELDEQDLPLHPYVLGAWLGDGTTTTGGMTAGLSDLEDMRSIITACGYELGEPWVNNTGAAASFTILGIRNNLVSAGLLGDKHIPMVYLRGSQKQREALLQGLMDTDGHIADNNQCTFVNTNPEIVIGIVELLKSLGIKATVAVCGPVTKEFPNGNIYTSKSSCRVSFTPGSSIQVFRLERKRTAQQVDRDEHWRRTKRFGIVSIEEVESVPVRCVNLNSPSHLFLAGSGMVPTHNSSQVEFVALQGKTPWLAPAKAIEELESYWATANTVNHSVLPWNHVDDDGNPVPAPVRQEPPTASNAYQMGMETAFNQMMMVSGQWQNQMGMMGNERTGAAIEARQGQGDIATFHYADNYMDGVRYSTKQLLDLIPRVYDNHRVIQIQADDGTDMEVEVDPSARQAYLEQQNHLGEVVKRVFNPSVGRYDVMAAVGPDYGTKRDQTVKALTLILTQAPALTGIIGDLLLQAMDFPDAEEAALRLRRMVPQQALGKGPSQAEQQLQLQVQNLTQLLVKALDGKAKDQIKLVGKDQMRDIDVYKAETDRFKALADSLMLDQGGIKAVVDQLVNESLQTNLTSITQANAGGISDQSGGADAPDLAGGLPPVPGAKKAPDGQWYLLDPTRKGKYLRVGSLAQDHAPVTSR